MLDQQLRSFLGKEWISNKFGGPLVLLTEQNPRELRRLKNYHQLHCFQNFSWTIGINVGPLGDRGAFLEKSIWNSGIIHLGHKRCNT